MDHTDFQDASGCTVTDYKLTFNFQNDFLAMKYFQLFLLNCILLFSNSSLVNSSIDMYSKYPAVLLKFLSPVFKKDTYTVTVTVSGERWWSKERSGRLSGSKGDFVSVEKIIVKE